jgi:hypothetical protein
MVACRGLVGRGNSCSVEVGVDLWGGGVEYKSKVLGVTLVLQLCKRDDDHVEGVLKPVVAHGESWTWTCKDATG